MTTPKRSIPPATREKLANPAGKGGRHAQALAIAYSLAGAGFDAEEIFEIIRPAFPADFRDSEIRRIAHGAVRKSPEPCQPRSHRREHVRHPRPVRTPAQSAHKSAEPPTPEQAAERCRAWLAGFTADEADLWHASPWVPPDDWCHDLAAALAALYEGDDFVNVVTDYREHDGKASPLGKGITLTRDAWLRYLATHPAPETNAGGWIRPNPVRSTTGAGFEGAYTDADIAAHRFLVLEADALPADVQVAMLARLKLPIALIVSSAGRSLHAWVRLDSPDEQVFRARSQAILAKLARYGFDPSTGNPSRMSRLPGATRRIGAKGNPRQRIFYLNPEPTPEPILDNSLTKP